jgi:hypothetical protein
MVPLDIKPRFAAPRNQAKRSRFCVNFGKELDMPQNPGDAPEIGAMRFGLATSRHCKSYTTAPPTGSAISTASSTSSFGRPAVVAYAAHPFTRLRMIQIVRSCTIPTSKSE